MSWLKNLLLELTEIGLSGCLDIAIVTLASFTPLVAALQGNLLITKSWHDLEL